MSPFLRVAGGNKISPVFRSEMSETPEVPIDNRHITRDEFMALLAGYRNEPEFSRLPLPTFAYQALPEYKGTELERMEDNIQYQQKQSKATSQEERESHMRERLRRKLEAKKR